MNILLVLARKGGGMIACCMEYGNGSGVGRGASGCAFPDLSKIYKHEYHKK